MTGKSDFYGFYANEPDIKLETCHRDPDNPSPIAGENVLYVCITQEENSTGTWIKLVGYDIDRATLSPSYVEAKYLDYG